MKNKIELTSEIKYQLLRDISHKIRGTLDLDKILNLLLDLLSNIIDYDAVGIFILSQDINHPGYHYSKQKLQVWFSADLETYLWNPMRCLWKAKE